MLSVDTMQALPGPVHGPSAILALIPMCKGHSSNEHIALGARWIPGHWQSNQKLRSLLWSVPKRIPKRKSPCVKAVLE